MSRVGKKPVLLPSGVSAQLEGREVLVKGPKGTLRLTLPRLIDVAIKDGQIVVTPRQTDRFGKSEHGLARNLIQNMVKGVTDMFAKELEIQGVGFRAEVKGPILQLALGFSHPIEFAIPEGIKVSVVKQTELTVQGCDRKLVGQICAEIRGLKPPEPYQGKGIRYKGEIVRRKVGKAAAGAAGA